MSYPSSAEVDFAVSAVREASRLVRTVQEEMVSPALTKEDRSPVTVGDFAAQAVIGRLIEQSYPEDPLVAEESPHALRQSPDDLDRVTKFVARMVPDADPDRVCDWIGRGTAEPTGRFWTLDPIDGTKGFLRREQYAVCLALIVDGEVRLGAMGCPNLAGGGRPDIGGPGSLLVAVRGHGSWAGPLAGDEPAARIHVSDCADPAQARVLRSVESGHTNVGQTGRFVEALGVEADPVKMDSQAKYAVLAAGGGELLVRMLSPSRPDYREKIWDQAAGGLIIQEAGGRITDLDGKPLDFSQGRTLAANRGVLASNGHLHDAALAALRKVGA